MFRSFGVSIISVFPRSIRYLVVRKFINQEKRIDALRLLGDRDLEPLIWLGLFNSFTARSDVDALTGMNRLNYLLHVDTPESAIDYFECTRGSFSEAEVADFCLLLARVRPQASFGILDSTNSARLKFLKSVIAQDVLCKDRNCVRDVEPCPELCPLTRRELGSMAFWEANRALLGNDVALYRSWVRKGFAFYDLSMPIVNGGGVVGMHADANSAAVDGCTVSVVMPVYNVSEYIESAIESLCNQTWACVEIIIVDDCSTDETYRIAERLASNDSRITVCSTETNSGPYVARNIGISMATGKYVTFLDGDDWAHPERLELHVQVMLDRGLVVSTSDWVRVSDDGYFVDRCIWPLVRRNMGSIMIGRDFIREHNLRFEEVRHGADAEFYYRMVDILPRNKVFNIQKPLTVAAFRNNSLTGSSDSGYAGRIDNPDRRKYWEGWHSRLL